MQILETILEQKAVYHFVFQWMNATLFYCILLCCLALLSVQHNRQCAFGPGLKPLAFLP
jgi:hypothetical protein